MRDLGELWDEILADMRETVSEPAYETALKNASVNVEPGGRVTLNFRSLSCCA